MTREEAKTKLHYLLSCNDPEAAHGEADAILLHFLCDNGFEDVAKAWEEVDDKVGFWYA